MTANKLEGKARELLAECLEELNATSHGPVIEGSLRDRIVRALDTARQSDDAEPFGWIDAEEMARHKREGTGGGIVCGSYSERYGRTTPLYLHPARQSEGMVLVPREPTEAMLDAGLRAEAFKRDEIHAYDDPAAVYRAMLAAAPADAGEG